MTAKEKLHPTALAGPPGEGDTSSLLVVDDSEANRDALSRRLQRRGYVVTTAADGAQALALLAERRFDLVLLDVMMPGLNGLDVLQIIRRDHPSTALPVIMATAKDESADIVRALELGASNYVIKPLDFAVVLARVQTQLSLKRSVQRVIELEQRLSHRNAELEASNARMKRDLRAAARIQEAFLPKSLPTLSGMNFAWSYLPCEALAGDFLNVCPLDADHVGIYVLDVSGHGVAAALLSVTLARLLSSASDPSSMLVHGEEPPSADRFVEPALVAERLNQKFPWDPTTEQFFTILYGVLSTKTGALRYVSAGHPGAVYLGRVAEPAILEGSDLPIGLGEGYEQHVAQLEPGDRLYLYSDGVTEAMSSSGQLFGVSRVMEALQRGRKTALQDSISLLLADLAGWCGSAPPLDDVSVLGIERLEAVPHSPAAI